MDNPLRVRWNATGQLEWRHLLRQAPYVPLEQSYEYGLALRQYWRMNLHHGILYHDKTPLACMQILSKRGISQALRAPVWLTADLDAAKRITIIQQFRQSFPRHLLRLWLPEIRDTPENRALLKQQGLWRIQQGYRTALLSLQQPSAALWQQLKPRWRAAIRCGQQQLYHISHNQHWPWFWHTYQQFRQEQQRRMPKAALVKAVAQTFMPRDEAHLYCYCYEEKPVAGILLLNHGNTTTYYAGITTPEGRTHQAHHVLLWHGIQLMQQSQQKVFDVGGLDDTAMHGVSFFKRGMGGTGLSLAGLYC